MSQTPVAMTFAHHANQLVIGNGYTDRDGITRICHGYTAMLELHRGYRVPAALHLSGTLVEALAWHHPEFLATVRAGLTEGWLTLVGGTYAEPIMPLASPDANRRQVATMASLLQRHLGMPGGALPTAWLPERVWDPDLLAVLTDPDLPGGGFRRVLVDERVLASSTTAGDGAGDRASVDRRGPYAWASGVPPDQQVTGLADPALARPRRIGGPRPLVLVPISAHLRYLIPPPAGMPVQPLERFVADLRARAAAPAAVLLCYGDDLERAAGVAGWRPALDRYAAVLRWVANSPLVRAVCLDQWLDEHPAPPGPTPAAGTYYELAVTWGAGENYRVWAEHHTWRPYAAALAQIEADIDAAREPAAVRRADRRLLALADRLAMVGAHETAWRDRDCAGPGRTLAPWVRAVASHARTARPVLAAARWAQDQPCPPCAVVCDVDRDGHDELVFAHETVWCLIAPREGARVCLLAHRAPDHMCSNVYPEGAAVIVGNPVDHWNFQEELNQFMDIPPGHPGALTDRYPHRAWVVDVPYRQSDAVTVEVRPAQPDAGTVSRCYALIAGIPALAACLHTEPGEQIDSTIIPDYLGALHDGAAGVQPSAGCCWRGWSWSSRQCWLGFDPDQAVPAAPRWSTAGHGRPVALTSPSGHLDVLLGAGSATDSDILHWLSAARRILHESSHAPRVRDGSPSEPYDRDPCIGWSTTTPAGNESDDGLGAARPG